MENSKSFLAALMLQEGVSLKETAKRLRVRHSWLLAVLTNETKIDFDFGVELEVNGLYHDDFKSKMAEFGLRTFFTDYHDRSVDISDMKNWRIEEDSSCGYELISPILRGEDGVAVLETAVRILDETHWKCDSTCGMHVHIARKDFNGTPHIERFIENYRRLEASIDSMLCPSRKRNRYCESIIGVEMTADYCESRYHKVNVNNRHTVEVRHHHGTTDWTEVSNWLYVLNAIFIISKTSFVSTSDVLEIIKNREVKSYVSSKKRAT
jgi:hypothetical protein